MKLVFLSSFRGWTSRAMWDVARALDRETGISLAVRALLPQWDPEASLVAAAVHCAGRQQRGYPMIELVAPADPLPDRSALERHATSLRLDSEAFARCIDDPATRRAVGAESEAAERLGLGEPPALLVNGRVFGGYQEAESLRAVVKQERARVVRPAERPRQRTSR